MTRSASKIILNTRLSWVKEQLNLLLSPQNDLVLVLFLKKSENSLNPSTIYIAFLASKQVNSFFKTHTNYVSIFTFHLNVGNALSLIAINLHKLLRSQMSVYLEDVKSNFVRFEDEKIRLSTLFLRLAKGLPISEQITKFFTRNKASMFDSFDATIYLLLVICTYNSVSTTSYDYKDTLENSSRETGLPTPFVIDNALELLLSKFPSAYVEPSVALDNNNIISEALQAEPILTSSGKKSNTDDMYSLLKKIKAIVEDVKTYKISRVKAQEKIEELYRLSTVPVSEISAFSKSETYFANQARKLYAHVFSDTSVDLSTIFLEKIIQGTTGLNNDLYAEQAAKFIQTYLGFDKPTNFEKNQALVIFVIQNYFSLLSLQKFRGKTAEDAENINDLKALEVSISSVGLIQLTDTMARSLHDNLTSLAQIALDPKANSFVTKQPNAAFFNHRTQGTGNLQLKSGLISAYIKFRDSKYISTLVGSEIPAYIQNEISLLAKASEKDCSLVYEDCIAGFRLLIAALTEGVEPLPYQTIKNKIFSTVSLRTRVQDTENRWANTVYLSLTQAISQFTSTHPELQEFITTYNLAFNLPMICEPKDWEYNPEFKRYDRGGYLKGSSRPLLQAYARGSSVISEDLVRFSAEALASVNLSQAKPYLFSQVSKEFWLSSEFLKEIEVPSPLEVEELGEIFNTSSETLVGLSTTVKKAYKNFDKIYSAWSQDRSSLAEQEYEQSVELEKGVKASQKKLKAFSLKISRLTSKLEAVKENSTLYAFLLDYRATNSAYFKSNKAFIVAKDKLDRHMFNFALMETFAGVEIYFPHIVDFRGRQYVITLGINKASGFYKYFLESAEKLVYDEVGIRNLSLSVAEAAFNDKGIVDYLDLDTSNVKQLKVEDLSIFVEKHRDALKFGELINKCSSFITSRSMIELKKALTLNNYSSGFLLRIDQAQSGPAILAFLFKDATLAKYTNLSTVPGEPRQDLYLLWLESFKQALKLSEPQLFAAFEPYLDRTLAKALTLPYFYNMDVFGFNLALKKHLASVKPLNSPKISGKDKYKFAKLAHEHTTDLAPCIHFFKQFFEELSIILAKENVAVRILHPDSSALTFGYFQLRGFDLKLPMYRTPTKPGQKSKKIEFSIPVITSIIDLEEQKRALSPNFIHSIDGYFVREITQNFFKATNGCAIIEALHDGFAVHPNHHDLLQTVIKDAYVQAFSAPNFLDKYLLKPCEGILYNQALEKEVRDLADKYNKFIIEQQKNNNYFDISDPKVKDVYIKSPYCFFFE